MNGNMNKKIANIFRAYDVRGIFPNQLNEEIAFIIGKAFANTITSGTSVAVARDVRSSSLAIHKALCEGITIRGVNVIDLGEVPSPLLYFSTHNLRLAGGAMVTASHLPPNWNGIKFCDSRGVVVSSGTGLDLIKETVLSKETNAVKTGIISCYKNSIIDYVKYIVKKIHLGRKLSIVVDYGNSVTANVVPLILEELGVNFKQINTNQGNFKRSSELTPDSLDELRRVVINNGSDLGIAYDADGDRVGFVDNLGNVYPNGEKIIPIFAGDALAKSKGDIIIDVTCSSAISKFISEKGGKPIVIRVGHSYCANEVLNRGALFGAQYSGHYSFPEMGCADDAIFASLKMIEILSNRDQRLSQILASMPSSYISKMVEVDCSDSAKFLVVSKIASLAKKIGYGVEEIDGVKIHSMEDNSDWVLIRASNTSPIIRINADGKSKRSVEKLLSLGINMVKDVRCND